MQRLARFVVRWPFAVIGLWVALAVALPLSLPTLTTMAEKHPLAMLPGDAPSMVAARQMAEAFEETGTENLMLVVLTDVGGLGAGSERTYRALVDALRDRTREPSSFPESFTTVGCSETGKFSLALSVVPCCEE